MAAEEATKVFANDEALAFHGRALQCSDRQGTNMPLASPRSPPSSGSCAGLSAATRRDKGSSKGLPSSAKLPVRWGGLCASGCWRQLPPPTVAATRLRRRAPEGRPYWKPTPLPTTTTGWRSGWTCSRCWVHGDQRAELEPFGQVIERMRPSAESRAGPAQRATFLPILNTYNLFAHPRLPDETTLGRLHTEWTIAAGAGVEYDVKFLRFALGIELSRSTHLAEARAELEATIDMGLRAGDRSLVLRCWSHLAWLVLRQHDVALAAEMAPARRRAGVTDSLLWPTGKGTKAGLPQ